MKSNYSLSLLNKLEKSRKVVKVFDTSIFVKSLVKGKKGGLDQREFELSKKTIKDRLAQKVDVETIRNSQGFPSINLNTVEMITDCIYLSYEKFTFKVWVYYPRKPFDMVKRKAIIYIHGGSFFAGSPFEQENMLKLLSERGNCVIFNVDISLAPEARFPIAINEVLTLISYIKNNYKQYKVDLDNIFISGDSSGANQALAVYQLTKEIKVKGMILYYPSLALTFDLPYKWNESDYVFPEKQREYIIPRLILGRSDEKGMNSLVSLIMSIYLSDKDNPKDPLLSPLFYDLKKYPKMLIFGAEYDGLRIQYEYFVSALRESKVKVDYIRYNGVHHGFNNKLGYFPQVEDSVNEIVRYINRD